jgi:putative oxidoreductase
MFPNGWPGRGLLLLRLAAGSVLIYDAILQLSARAALAEMLLQVAIVLAALLLLAGLWTPVVGVLMAVLEICNSFLNTGHIRSVLLLAALGLSLAMLGPGVSSLDARLFGRKRIDISPHGSKVSRGEG